MKTPRAAAVVALLSLLLATLTVAAVPAGTAYAEEGTAPAPVTGVRVEPLAEGLWVGWDQVTGATGYTVSVEPGGHTATSDWSTYASIHGLPAGVEHTVTVTASNQHGTSAPSAPVTGTPTRRVLPPAPVSDVAVGVDPDSSRLVVTWRPAPEDLDRPVAGYQVTARMAGGGASQVEVEADATEARPGVVAWGFAHEVTVTALNAAGRADSAGVVVTPTAPPVFTRRLIADPGDGSALLSWDAVERGTPVSGGTVTVLPGGAVHRVPAGARDVVVPKLRNGRRVTLRLVLHSAAGDSEARSVDVVPAGAPGAPRRLRATAQAAAVRLTWRAAPANGSAVRGYEVRGPNGMRVQLGRAARGYTYRHAVPGRYTFRVRALNAAGWGRYAVARARVVR